ncbi:MAG: MarR family transcriptional regulator [Desulfobacteraceae bacterium]|nr:MarR family transcriptional regulator [Desulfobacteraceae bacterium]
MNKKRHKIVGKFQSIMEHAQALEKAPRTFGTGKNLVARQIHLIEIIGDHEGSSVTDIAKLLGVTKGAVSQNLKKLEALGFSIKQTDPQNLSRSVVKLTAKGMSAYWSHKDWHEQMDGGFAEYMDKLEEKDVDTILDFMTKTEDFLKRMLASVE